jgi:dGTPase
MAIFATNSSTMWNKLICGTRTGKEHASSTTTPTIGRSHFQRDYDRLIFSSAFRRMQNKTQVFPLPGAVFVHNRLTHSLEVASVGRTLGSLIADELVSCHPDQAESIREIPHIVAAACLAHDMGNPPFGHAGETIISGYFRDNHSDLQGQLTKGQWNDLVFFDGNANALRLLTAKMNGRRDGGFGLSYSTLASIIKYPYESSLTNKNKFGFFQAEKGLAHNIATTLGLKEISSDPLKFERYPLTFLVEAADDICYLLMDLEDAHKLGILSSDEVFNLLYPLAYDPNNEGELTENLNIVTDPNERIAYLRAVAISRLIQQCAAAYIAHIGEIETGNFHTPLIKLLPQSFLDAADRIVDISVKKIYNHHSVVEIEIAGYRILSTLCNEFTEAMLHPERNLSKKLITRIPVQYNTQCKEPYDRLMTVVDFISGMTDVYALELYRNITGISIPGIVK